MTKHILLDVCKNGMAFGTRHKQFVTNFCKYGLGLGLLAWVIWSNWYPPPGNERGGIREVLNGPEQLTPLLLGTAIYLVSVSLTFVRWYVLVRAQDLPFTMTNAVRLGLVGVSMSTLLPGSIGGDLFKAAFIAREQSRRTVAVATVLIDRVIGLLGLIWLVVLLGAVFWLSGNDAMHKHRSLQLMVTALAGVVVGSGLAWVVVGVLPQWRAARIADAFGRIPKIGHSVAELWRALWMYRLQGRSVALALGLALIGHVGFVLTFFFAAQAFLPRGQMAQIPSLEESFLIVPIGMTCQAGIPTPGGVGGGEYVFGKLYALIGKPENLGILASIVARLIAIGVSVVGYLVYLGMKPAAQTGLSGATSLAA